MKIILMCVLRLSENTNKMQTEVKKNENTGKIHNKNLYLDPFREY